MSRTRSTLSVASNQLIASASMVGNLVRAYSPTVELTDTDDGVIISITDIDGEHTATVYDGTGIQGETGVGISSISLNADYTLTITTTDGTEYTTESIRGEQGASGADGADGADGNGIATVVLNEDYTLTLTFTDGTTYTTSSIRGAQGEAGATGVGISSITKTDTSGLVDTYTITLTDDTTTTFTVTNGLDASVTVDDALSSTSENPVQNNVINSAISSLNDEIADKYEKPASGIPASDLASGVIPDVPVTDVQVNGTSVLSSGVANVPAATAAEIKAGAVTGALIAPALQQAAAFYGLATAAGDATQAASSNAVGTYTDDALVAVQKMLGIYEAPWEVIKEGSFTNDTADAYDFTTDSNGQTFELTDVALFIETPVQSTASAIGSYGSIRFYYDSGSDFDVLMIDAWSQSANGGPRAGGCIIEQRGGMIFKTAIRAAGSGSNGLLAMRYGSGNHSFVLLGSERYFYKISILSATGTINYKLYGKRRWRQ